MSFRSSHLPSSHFQRGATVVYATHIFDGLEEWVSHLAYLSAGSLKRFEDLAETPGKYSSLLSTVEQWLRKEQEEKVKEEEARKKAGVKKPVVDPFAGFGRHMSHYR